MTDLLTPVLSEQWGQANSWKLARYEATGGYRAVRKAFDMSPEEVIGLIKDANLRGRGGAGFPTGMKWSFVPQDNPNPKYLVVNADESEPGTCKDIPLMMATPHTLVEGVIIASYAINANTAFIYCRGEVLHVIRRLQQAGGLEGLPEKLRQSAQLRLENPEATLQELADMQTPPVSKSAINHRMRKLVQLAAQQLT